jgi:hypothetical protein
VRHGKVRGGQIKVPNEKEGKPKKQVAGVLGEVHLALFKSLTDQSPCAEQRGQAYTLHFTRKTTFFKIT